MFCVTGVHPLGHSPPLDGEITQEPLCISETGHAPQGLAGSLSGAGDGSIRRCRAPALAAPLGGSLPTANEGC